MVRPSSRRKYSLRDRIGIALETRVPVLEGVEWAAANDVHFVDFRPDERSLDPNAYPEDEVDAIRDCCAENDIHFGLHSLSGINTSETAPYVAEGIDRYFEAYIDLAVKLGAEWVIVHPGYHFGSGVDSRRQASIDRLRRIANYGHENRIPVVTCNMNREPDDGEVHYFGTTLEDYNHFASELPQDRLGLAFNAPHANLLQTGIDGFLDALDVDRIWQVRLNDNRGTIEEHLPPGEGNIDFDTLFTRLESAGYDGHYTLSWDSRTEMLDGREFLVELTND